MKVCNHFQRSFADCKFTTTALDLDWVQPPQDGGVILPRAIRGSAVGGCYSGVEESVANTHVDRINKGRNELERGIYKGSTPSRPLVIHYLIRSFHTCPVFG